MTKLKEERVQLFHRTPRPSMLRILGEGFRSGKGCYMCGTWLRGVWVSDRPLDCNEGAGGSALLGVSIRLSLIERFELVEEGKPYREWCVPAYILNRRAKLQVLEDGEADEHPKADNLVPVRRRPAPAPAAKPAPRKRTSGPARRRPAAR